MTITDKWTMTASGEWIKVPFIREANGDRRLSVDDQRLLSEALRSSSHIIANGTSPRAAEQRKDMTNGRS